MSKKEPSSELKKIVKELYSFTTPRTASSWETNMVRWPIGASSNSGSSERNFINRAKEDEEKAKAPKIKPYPLDFINDSIVKNYEELIKTKRLLLETLKYPSISSAEKTVLKKEIKVINVIIDRVKKMYYNIDKISL
jgi:hypothetical protein